jgi:isoleucyl-tRNA synthetase
MDGAIGGLSAPPLRRMPCMTAPLISAHPSVFDAVTPEHMQRVRAMAAEGSYRKDSRSENWIGRAVAEVLNLDLDDEAERKQVKDVLKVWFANGVLEVKLRKDGTRHERNYVAPGNWADEGCVS